MKLPGTPGVYALSMVVDKPATIIIGALGVQKINPGFYYYVGSARGPGGIKSRVMRHLQQKKVTHWHIDYLLPFTRLAGVWYAESPAPLECNWVGYLHRLEGGKFPIKKFGSSDCCNGCPAHLLQFSNFLSSSSIRSVFEESAHGVMIQHNLIDESNK
jgi:Uri superfamily endonuclease